MDETDTIRIKDHTGAGHDLPIYDAGNALAEAIRIREAQITLPATKREVNRDIDLNGMRGKERG